jgi:Tfp pilus assembly protein PilE
LVELLVAIIVAGIISVMAFTFYTNVVKGYWLHDKRSEAVKEAIAARIIINRRFSTVDKVVSCRKDGFDYVKANEDTMRTIKFAPKALMDNNDTILKNLTTFSTSIALPAQKQQGRGVLLLEAETNNGNWVAGATAVNVAPAQSR